MSIITDTVKALGIEIEPIENGLTPEERTPGFNIAPATVTNVSLVLLSVTATYAGIRLYRAYTASKSKKNATVDNRVSE